MQTRNLLAESLLVIEIIAIVVLLTMFTIDGNVTKPKECIDSNFVYASYEPNHMYFDGFDDGYRDLLDKMSDNAVEIDISEIDEEMMEAMVANLSTYEGVTMPTPSVRTVFNPWLFGIQPSMPGYDLVNVSATPPKEPCGNNVDEASSIYLILLGLFLMILMGAKNESN